MVLAGGGSGIRGLGALIERRLSDMGEVNVHVVDDPVRLGAMGGLRLAMEVPEDMWKNFDISISLIILLRVRQEPEDCHTQGIYHWVKAT